MANFSIFLDIVSTYLQFSKPRTLIKEPLVLLEKSIVSEPLEQDGSI